MGITDCRECGAPVSTKARACPGCGARRGGGGGCLRTIIITLAVFLVLLAAVLVQVAPHLPGGSVSMEEWGLRRIEYGRLVIRGSATNTGGRQLRHVMAEFTLHDATGAHLGSTMASTSNLEPGATWKFEAPVFYDGVAEAQFKGFTAY